MKFKIDENLPVQIAELLDRQGHDAESVFAEGFSGATDAHLADICGREHRAMLTLDLDFADITTYPPADFHGIIVLRLEQQDRLHVIATIKRLLPLLQTEQLSGALWIVDEQRIRIRD
jgi:predicted nuclease of predicted toxin-antitoxin system